MRNDLDFSNLRPIHGSLHEGFEVLCCQLADSDRPRDTVFIRKGTPDAGVECYAVYDDGRELGWQAKFFDSLGSSQWAQIDKSVKAALKAHPNLTRYTVCLPIDLPDARIKGRLSGKDRWEKSVGKWSGWAKARKMRVKFDLWGKYELINRLSLPENRGRLLFWFGKQDFDASWFRLRLKEAVEAAGPRYTPQLHVSLPLASQFEALGRTERFFDALKGRARAIREKLRALGAQEVYGNPGRAMNSGDDRSGEAGELIDGLELVKAAARRLLDGFARISASPVGSLPFRQVADQASGLLAAAEPLGRILSARELLFDSRQTESRSDTAFSYLPPNPYRQERYALGQLERESIDVQQALIEADRLATTSITVLTGVAGTGKTHLLCDVASSRLKEGRPTVLLMGQRFRSADDPWHQALHHLDLAGTAVEEFVGALEAAAQAAGSRALVLIDALNEGNGRDIWPQHLAAFLAHLRQSEWISVVLSTRSSYERRVIPEEIIQTAVRLEHRGFVDREFDAAKLFFDHYGLELPSSPTLSPEFTNPLFLKVLCQGLSAREERRLPRGFLGISAIFDLFLDAVEKQLAADLKFDRKEGPVREAVERLSRAYAEKKERSLPRNEAKAIVDAILPGRDFELSLYDGLVTAGVLVEEAVWQGESEEEVVQIGYERLSDHLITKHLLDAHLDPDKPEVAFGKGGPLAYVAQAARDGTTGLVESFCIQLPERIGREYPDFAPSVESSWAFPELFCRSVIWRRSDCFSRATKRILNRLSRSDQELDLVVDLLFTLATVPHHPLNATFLHKRLTKDLMPDRDAWWSLALHRAWRERGAMERLIEWAWTVAPDSPIPEDVIELSSIALAWMFTTPNRFVRDRATKALVGLLSSRLRAAVRLVEQFNEIDDPYVVERVYAVAYGCAMRSHDQEGVGALAQTVYDHVFSQRHPPTHILLRDYARGAVERALHLGCPLNIELERIRPPYRSRWPRLPSERQIRALRSDKRRGSAKEQGVDLAKDRIGHSIFDDDFAFYVIGTNFSTVNGWLALRLNDPIWRSPDERLEDFVAALNARQKQAWKHCQAANDKIDKLSFSQFLLPKGNQGMRLGHGKLASGRVPTHLRRLERERKDALGGFNKSLSPGLRHEFQRIREAQAGDPNQRLPPQFDVKQIQRFILRRVFELGWTSDRFGRFDRQLIGGYTRSASKPERVGKKYQWIAYHEIMALLADHFQYRADTRTDEGAGAYQGSWQGGFRDIDPSCVLRRALGGTSWESHTPAWWCAWEIRDWQKGLTHSEWISRSADLPPIVPMLAEIPRTDGTTWVNLNAYMNWQQPIAPDGDPHEADRREIWFMCNAYLVRTHDAAAFMKWARRVDFWNRWMPEPPNHLHMFLGEHSWSPASEYFAQPYHGVSGWTQPSQGCPVSVLGTTARYSQESGGFDCSVDDEFSLRLPSRELVQLAGWRWSGDASHFLDHKYQLAAFDPTVLEPGPSSLLIRQDVLKAVLDEEGLTLCWTVLGERRVIPAGLTSKAPEPLRLSGAYSLKSGKVSGFLKRIRP